MKNKIIINESELESLVKDVINERNIIHNDPVSSLVNDKYNEIVTEVNNILESEIKEESIGVLNGLQENIHSITRELEKIKSKKSINESTVSYEIEFNKLYDLEAILNNINENLKRTNFYKKELNESVKVFKKLV